MKRYNKIPAELVVSPREVLEARPRSSPPPGDTHEDDTSWSEHEDDTDNCPCTD